MMNNVNLLAKMTIHNGKGKTCVDKKLDRGNKDNIKCNFFDNESISPN
ncbi:hypothetical protein [Helicobacter muridarum]|nr:hypothetical protein [Helicobacter muridarum]